MRPNIVFSGEGGKPGETTTVVQFVAGYVCRRAENKTEVKFVAGLKESQQKLKLSLLPG